MSRVEDALKAANETCALRIGREVLNEVAVMFKEQFPGKRAVVVADETTWDVAGKKVEEELNRHSLLHSRTCMLNILKTTFWLNH